MNVGPGDLLVVDDATGALKEINSYLDESGYNTKTVATQVDCLQWIKSEKPDLLILKADAPSFNLLEIFSHLQSETGVLLLIDHDSVEEFLPLLNGVATDYLDLPVQNMALLGYAVKKIIRQVEEVRRRKKTELELDTLNKTLAQSLRVLERDQYSGLMVQQNMMPESPMVIGNVTFSHKIIPSLILSGDFVDYAEISDERLLFLISDVSGHGASSAFVTVLLKSLSRRLQREAKELELDTPGKILKWINQELRECELDHHVTMFIGILDKFKKKLQYANAAQFPGAILSSRDETRFLEIGGLPLGLYSNAEYEDYVIDLQDNFTLIMFSDGVFEIMSEQTLKAKEEYLLSLVKYGNRSIDTLSDHLGLNSLTQVPDDIAVLTVSKAG